MAVSDLPPGMSYNPSERSRRLPGSAPALTGFCIATYLALYQVGVIAAVWEPFFGNGSRLLLKQSAVAHLLPIPDAALGAAVYLLEVITGAIGGRAAGEPRRGWSSRSGRSLSRLELRASCWSFSNRCFSAHSARSAWPRPFAPFWRRWPRRRRCWPRRGTALGSARARPIPPIVKNPPIPKDYPCGYIICTFLASCDRLLLGGSLSRSSAQ